MAPLKRRITVFIGLITLSIIALVASTAYAASITMPSDFTTLGNAGSGSANINAPFDVTEIDFYLSLSYPPLQICISQIDVTINTGQSSDVSVDIYAVIYDSGNDVLGVYGASNVTVAGGSGTVSLSPAPPPPDTPDLVCNAELPSAASIEIYGVAR